MTDEAMRFSASLRYADGLSENPDCLSSSEVAFIFSKTMQDLRQIQVNCTDVSLAAACLAIACSDPTSYSHIIPSERLSQLVSEAFTWIVFGRREIVNSDQESPDSFAQAIQSLTSASDGNKAFAWVNNLFIEASDAKSGASDGGSILANCLWEAVTG